MGMAFLESFIVYHSIVVTIEIIRKMNYSLCHHNKKEDDVTSCNATSLPGISVDEYYSEIMQQEEDLKRIGRKGQIRTICERDFSDENGHSSLHGTSRHSTTHSITLRDFPDFDKFQAHLEDVEMNASPKTR